MRCFAFAQHDIEGLRMRTKEQNFNQKVYMIVQKIPKGKVATYGQIAEKLGKRRWSRQVGWALHANKSSSVPCHRGVDRHGRLAPNFAFSATPGGGAIEQHRRLEVEGVEFIDEMHVDLASCQVANIKS